MSSEDNGGCGCGCLTLIGLLVLAGMFPQITIVVVILVIIGVFLHFTDSNNAKTKRQRAEEAGFGRNPINDIDVTTAIMRLVGYVARGNDVITRQEINQAENIIQQLDPAHRSLFINAFNNGKAQNYDPERDISYIKYVAAGQMSFLQSVLSILVYIAIADGEIKKAERERINIVAYAFGFNSIDVDALIREMSPHNFKSYSYQSNSGSSSGSGYGYGYGYGYGSDSHHAGGRSYGYSSEYDEAMSLLGVTGSSTPDEITRQYKKLIRKYHPDLIKAKGLPENMREVYEQKTKEINEAYDIVKKHRGF